MMIIRKKRTFMVAEVLQNSKFLLYILYSCYMKFYFCYIFHIYVTCFIMYLLYIHMYIMYICLITLLFSLYVQNYYNVKFSL